MHQDWWYFPTRNDSMIAATIFLSDADDSTGGFRVYPGSHKLGRPENSSGLSLSESLSGYPFSGATPLDVRRGDDEVLENARVNHVNERPVLAGWNHQMCRATAATKGSP